MTTMRAIKTFHHGGGTVFAGAEFPATHPVPQAFAVFFAAIEDETPKRRTRRGKAGDDE